MSSPLHKSGVLCSSRRKRFVLNRVDSPETVAEMFIGSTRCRQGIPRAFGAEKAEKLLKVDRVQINGIPKGHP